MNECIQRGELAGLTNQQAEELYHIAVKAAGIMGISVMDLHGRMLQAVTAFGTAVTEGSGISTPIGLLNSKGG